MTHLVLTLVLLLSMAPETATPAPRVDDEIALARSAAPPQVSADATVMVLQDGQYVVGARGSNDVVCMVSRSRPGSREPICYDAEAARTILPMEIRRVELRLAGESSETIERIIAEGIGSGEFQLPRRPAMSYMMSSGQVLISGEGRNVGNWYPHLMLYWPYLRGAELGLQGKPSLQAGVVFDEGLPTAHLVIPVREFIDP
ncbi:MAG: hypothetical protein GWN99_19715 [Gemmatimonadetes bacterium]|uniref:Uncharacterized protein n=1 Tax=Candidatus Kutchimonas denitrificans TaxID=3056748 RepID=A0AAE4ZBS5_9BACT|nr:hypothetical protein [Gemmatimonadota bacterium]NIR76432.1 hypothetical protein [Candidatus Kutchimonas denitrificans]NIS03251.1 hypothetical protein [Gemmatimonadota bacterium]NIT69112.1 hypothetical protein [Gemmatimonadota bacterium]NIU54504.1 hypothetical protein [Gemmatimonadota bacterium]